MTRFELVAMGGTFDIIHKGHISLLKHAFEISSKVIIGLTSDDLAIRRGKKLNNNYEKRFENLENIIKNNFPNSEYRISKLDDDFGPAVLEENVQALVVSEETSYQGPKLNQLRNEKDLPPLEVIVVPMELADDGKRISSTRIRNSEIDSKGHLS